MVGTAATLVRFAGAGLVVAPANNTAPVGLRVTVGGGVRGALSTTATGPPVPAGGTHVQAHLPVD